MTNPNAPGEGAAATTFRDDKPYFDAMFQDWCEDVKAINSFEFPEQPFVAYRLAHQRQQQEIERLRAIEERAKHVLEPGATFTVRGDFSGKTTTQMAVEYILNG